MFPEPAEPARPLDRDGPRCHTLAQARSGREMMGRCAGLPICRAGYLPSRPLAGLPTAAARGSPKGIVRTPMPQQGMQSKHRARKDVQQGMSFLKAGDLEAARAIF